MNIPAEHSALVPAGVQASRILRLFYAYFGVSAVVFTLVIAALGFALSGSRSAPAKREPAPGSDANKARAVTWATVATVITLIGLLVGSVSTGHALALIPADGAVQVEVRAHKWWWEFRYPMAGSATRFSTAYELHIPVGRTVELQLIATDVIHSFWVPSLQGKMDAIPGKDRRLLLRADRAGVFEGQCAEFCGTEHAQMRFRVVAESPARFEAWKKQSASSAEPPGDPLRQRGLEVFMANRCASCHAISGSDAFGTVGPDLTHVASRRGLAMGTLPNDRAHLKRWLSDPQLDKPGVQMPSTPLSANDERALLAYVGGLK